MPRFYTLAEATALLPELTELLEDLRTQVERLATLQTEMRAVREHVQSNGHGARAEQLGTQAAPLERQVRARLARLQELEIELKDVEQGLIDFYHERAGRTVFLCWKLGEPAIAFWHDLDSGFAGRQPLP